MIRFSLTCPERHRFDSWFPSSEAFDSQSARGLVACATCGSTDVTKAPMAPSLASSGAERGQGNPLSRPAQGPEGEVERRLAELRRRIEDGSDYVGLSFAAEARAMHLGDKPHRPIHGEASAGEARALIEEGVPVAPLPFRPRAKSN